MNDQGRQRFLLNCETYCNYCYCCCFLRRFLEVVKQSEDENAAEFARRVQTMMACALGVEPTTFTSADKSDLVRRMIAASAATSNHRGMLLLLAAKQK